MLSLNFAQIQTSREFEVDQRIYNFSAGPAVLPPPVLEKAQSELLSLGGIGMSVMEISHRSHHFESILNSARDALRELLSVPQNYEILFLQGGASFQFSMVPINFLERGRSADYVITGAWGEKALAEAMRCGNAEAVFSTADSGYTTVPEKGEIVPRPDSAYIHYTSNETIEGVEFDYDLDGGRVPVICDASSNILSKPIDVEKYALIYAGAQKNIGPSGVTMVIIRDDMLERVPAGQHSLLDYRKIAENGSMLNTPNTWGIYLIDLVCDWLRSQGGVTSIQKRNEAKAALLYEAIDSSDGFYTGHAERQARSKMNVTFRLPSEVLESEFCGTAASLGLDGLKGHRSVGGIRASIYNAFPREGVEALVEFMKDFTEKNG